MKNFRKLTLVFGLVWRVSPGYLFLLLFNSLAYAGQILSNVVLPKFLIDEIMGNTDAGRLAFWVGMIAGANLLFTLLKKTGKRLLDVQEKTVNWLVERAFALKIMSVEYRHLEDPETLDLKERASFAMKNQGAVPNLIQSLVGFFNQALTIAGLVTIMLQLSWILVILLLAAVAVMLLIQASFAGFQQRFFAEILPVNRRYGYYVGLTFEKLAHKDMRLYNMSGMLGDTITRYNREINDWFGRCYRKQGLFMGLFQIVVVLQTALAYGYVGSRTLGGGIGIGSLTMYVSSALSFSSAVISLGMAIVTILQMLGYLEPFTRLMSTPDEAECSSHEKLVKVHSICFEHVSFSYPKTDKKILDDISFEIRGGEKISVVGLNGAGKSTVVKLLCRLYRPDSGRITINGTDIFKYDYRAYLAVITAVFQDFKLFNFTLEENITCASPTGQSGRVDEILDEVGMKEKLRALPHGLASLYGKEYDQEGVEFSGGQAQKLAIARALYKNASLVILDEPTSALDPLAEAEIYENFNSMVGDRTALYISHRMSSSVFCDRVLVINNGRIEAFDSHSRLMENREGTHYKLFTSQAENYRLKASL